LPAKLDEAQSLLEKAWPALRLPCDAEVQALKAQAQES